MSVLIVVSNRGTKLVLGFAFCSLNSGLEPYLPFSTYIDEVAFINLNALRLVYVFRVILFRVLYCEWSQLLTS